MYGFVDDARLLDAVRDLPNGAEIEVTGVLREGRISILQVTPMEAREELKEAA